MMAEFVRDGVFKSKKLKKALAAGDEVAIEAVDRACHYLAIATGNMINTISPDLIVYGGGVMEAVGDVFLEKILKELDRYCMRSIRPTVDIKIAELGDDSILYGDLAMIEASKNGFLFRTTDKIKEDYPHLQAFEEYSDLLAAIKNVL